MSKQTKKLNALRNEFQALKLLLFGTNSFVVLDENSEEVKRYNQLLQFFYPCFRTKDFINPLQS